MRGGFCMPFERRLSVPPIVRRLSSHPFSTQICGSPENGRPLFFFSLFCCLLSLSGFFWPSVPVTGVGQWGDWRDRVRLVEFSLLGAGVPMDGRALGRVGTQRGPEGHPVFLGAGWLDKEGLAETGPGEGGLELLGGV